MILAKKSPRRRLDRRIHSGVAGPAVRDRSGTRCATLSTQPVDKPADIDVETPLHPLRDKHCKRVGE